MTETSCVISAMDGADNISGHVGSPNPACGELLSTGSVSLTQLINGTI